MQFSPTPGTSWGTSEGPLGQRCCWKGQPWEAKPGLWWVFLLQSSTGSGDDRLPPWGKPVLGGVTDCPSRENKVDEGWIMDNSLLWCTQKFWTGRRVTGQMLCPGLGRRAGWLGTMGPC